MDILDRFWSHVDRSGGPEACWPWKDAKRNKAGYGAFVVDRRTHVAHRWLLGHLRGRPLGWPAEVACHRPVCKGFKGCCNPAHLYVGSHSDNARDAVQSGNHWGAANAAKTRCLRDHEFTDENTHRFGPDGRLRYCRECKREQSRESARKRRAEDREMLASGLTYEEVRAARRPIRRNLVTKMTAAGVAELRRDYPQGRWKSQREAAEHFGVTQENVSNILRGKTWRDVT